MTGVGPLSGLRVVDFSRVLAGPYCTMLLGDMGAEVIKVEEPGVGDPSRHNAPYLGGESHYFLSINRGKKSVALDLKDPRGSQLALELAAKADVVIENFRPGRTDEYGVDYERVRALNPGVIYCSISGFGQDGPIRDLPAYNEVIQALSGVMSLNGEPTGPPMKLGMPICDLAGGLFAVQSVTAALFDRTRTGQGQRLDISLFDCTLGMLGYFASWFFITGESPLRVGSNHHSIAPVGVFATRDGYLSLSVFTTKFWVKFCTAAGRSDLATDMRFARAKSRVENQAELYATLRALIGERSTAEWTELLGANDVPHAPVLTVGQALQHPQAKARNMILNLPHASGETVSVVGRSVKFRGQEGAGLSAPPLLGEDTAGVLQSVLGLSQGQIDELAAAKVVERPSDRTQSGHRSE